MANLVKGFKMADVSQEAYDKLSQYNRVAINVQGQSPISASKDLLDMPITQYYVWYDYYQHLLKNKNVRT